MKTVLLASLGSLALAFAAAAAEPPPPETLPDPLPLDWCLARAAAANPEIAEMRADAEAARERVVPAGAFEDPRFVYEASNIPVNDFDFDSTPLSGNQLGLRQMLPFPGLLSAREDSAERDSEAATLELADRRRLVASRVEGAWAELGFAQRALEITDRNVGLLRQLTRIAEVKYSVGEGLQQDVLRAQVELTALLQERLERVSALERARARLSALLDLPPNLALPETAGLDEAAPIPDLEPLFARTVEASPLLAAQRARVEAARFAARAAELEGYPDVDLGIGYRVRRRVAGDPVDGDDFVSAGFTIRLPVDRSKWRAREAEKRALLRRAEARLRAQEAALTARLREVHAQLVRADAEAELLRTGLVPQARQSLDSSRSAYEVGRIEFLSLLDSQVRLLDAELRAVRAASDRRTAFGALEAVVGEDLR